MTSLRPLLSALLGLALLVQGVAVAATPLASAPSEPVAAQQSAPDAMPCHGDVQKADPADMPPCDCCDDGCADMSGCAFGHLALVSAVRLQLAPVAQSVSVTPDRAADSVPPPSRLRPPISFHA